VVAVLRVMICDHSPGDALALRRMLEHDGDIRVVARTVTAEETMAVLSGMEVDLVAIDMGLAGTTGLEAVEEIMSRRPLPVLALMANVSGQGDEAAAALAAGALEAIGKNEVQVTDPAGRAGAAFRDRVRLLARAKVIRHPRARLRGHRQLPSGGRHVSVIGICASTGGPKTLASLLAQLPAGYPIPLLIVQHISPGFTDGLVRWLDLVTRVPVRVAANGTVRAPGTWIAPEGANLRLGARGRFELDRTASGNYLPSGDALFASIAAVAGRTGGAVVLTGMGRDGAQGAAAVRLAGGFAIAQDEETSPVYGMPRAAAEIGVDLVLSPGEIVSYLLGLTYQPLPGGS
jgi:two-component system chemotaxis response regulator CheB